MTIEEAFCPLCAETHPCRRDVNERLTHALETLEVYGTSLKDRVDVENELRAIGIGKAPLPTREQCLEMARQLGVPMRVRNAFDKQMRAPRSRAAVWRGEIVVDAHIPAIKIVELVAICTTWLDEHRTAEEAPLPHPMTTKEQLYEAYRRALAREPHRTWEEFITIHWDLGAIEDECLLGVPAPVY